MSEEIELVQVAMQIILHAGNARNNAIEALQEAKKFNFEKAQELMDEADKNITLAHKAQTETVQSEMSGKTYEYSMLFAHAQDTLMTIMSEISMSKEMIDILKIIKNGGA